MKDFRVKEKNELVKAHDDIFNHFRERLLERYGLYINRESYDKLCASPFLVFRQEADNKSLLGVVAFNSKLILVIKAKRKKHVLLTALPPKGIKHLLVGKVNKQVEDVMGSQETPREFLGRLTIKHHHKELMEKIK